MLADASEGIGQLADSRREDFRTKDRPADGQNFRSRTGRKSGRRLASSDESNAIGD
jgi:hypothetical protein